MFCNFSAPLADWIQMHFKLSVGKCPKTLSDLIIWTRYDQKCEDRLKSISTFLTIICTGDPSLMTQSQSLGNNVNCYFMKSRCMLNFSEIL